MPGAAIAATVPKQVPCATSERLLEAAAPRFPIGAVARLLSRKQGVGAPSRLLARNVAEATAAATPPPTT